MTKCDVYDNKKKIPPKKTPKNDIFSSNLLFGIEKAGERITLDRNVVFKNVKIFIKCYKHRLPYFFYFSTKLSRLKMSVDIILLFSSANMRKVGHIYEALESVHGYVKLNSETNPAEPA